MSYPMPSPTDLDNELYAGLTEIVRRELSSHGVTAIAARGTRLVEKGTAPTGLVILNAGSAETTVVVAGKEVSLGTDRPGKVFALHPIISGAKPEVTVTCLEDCRVTIVPKEAFLEILSRHPEMYFAVGKVLSADLASADRVIRECARGFQSNSGSNMRPV